MRFAYADPPYLGMCRLYEHDHHGGGCWNDIDTHRALIDRLTVEYPDGWVLSLSAPSLRPILALCPDDVRVAPWVKTWHQIRPTIPVQYAWEPVVWRGGRRGMQTPMVRDWLASPATRMRGTPGAKPEVFTRWVLGLLGAQPDDIIEDLIAGSGGVAVEVANWRSQTRWEALA
jgi:hypothetical protein